MKAHLLNTQKFGNIDIPNPDTQWMLAFWRKLAYLLNELTLM